MKKESKKMLKLILRNQELIMKALKIEIPIKDEKKDVPQKLEEKKVLAKKTIVKRPVKKIAKRK